MASEEERVKAYAIECGASVVGIASGKDINERAPEGHRPDDYLPNAKTVIMVGGPMLTAGAWRSPNARFMATSHMFPAISSEIVRRIAAFIENEYGHYATVCSGLTVGGNNPFISLKLCAEMAGLGTRAMAGGVIMNKEFGVMNLAGVISTMPLKPDGPLKEPVCPDIVCVKMWNKNKITPCLKSCPTCLSGELENGRIKRMQYRRHLCLPRAAGTVPAFQQMLLKIIEERDPEVRKQLVFGDFFTRTINSIATSLEVFANCFECLRFCPICVRARTLKARPLLQKRGEV
jgi:hypothetical protein